MLVGAGVEAGRGLDEVGAGGDGGLGRVPDLRLGERVGLEDDLDRDAGGVAGVDHGAEVVLDGVEVAAADASVVGDDVDLVHAGVEDVVGLRDAGRRRGAAEREVDDDADSGARVSAERVRDPD